MRPTFTLLITILAASSIKAFLLTPQMSKAFFKNQAILARNLQKTNSALKFTPCEGTKSSEQIFQLETVQALNPFISGKKVNVYVDGQIKTAGYINSARIVVKKQGLIVKRLTEDVEESVTVQKFHGPFEVDLAAVTAGDYTLEIRLFSGDQVVSCYTGAFAVLA